MVMKRRYKKRTYRRRPAYKKRIYKKRSSYDNQIKLKCIMVREVEAKDGSNSKFVVNWSNRLDSLDLPTVTLDESMEFKQYGNIHKEVLIKGCKIEFMPMNNLSGATNVAMFNVSMVNRVLELPNNGMTRDECLSTVGYMERQYGYMKRYIKVNKWLRTKGVGWLSSGTNGSGLDSNPVGGTLVWLQHSGFGVGAVMGHVKVTWYVKFRNPRYAP